MSSQSPRNASAPRKVRFLLPRQHRQTGPLRLGLDARKEAVQQRLNGGRWQLVAEFVEIESGKRAKLASLPRRHRVLDCADAAQVSRAKTAGRQIFTRFRLNRSAGRACATDAQAITTEVGGHVESLCCRSCCFRSFCRVLQPTQYLACALFDVDVDGTSLRLPLSLDGSRSQPSPYEFCLGCK